ncbi:MAG TPA: Ig-like domain repeat protein [Acidobacteriaceae bacterium]
MILLFRKYLSSRPAVRLLSSTGILATLAALALNAGAQAQVATRTHLATQQDAGALSLTAKVADVQGNPISEGSVSFETAKGSLGSVFVQGGAATLHLTNPPAWARSITAVYHGGAAFAASSASASVMPAATGLAGFTVTASPSSLTLTPGDYSTVDLTITSQNGFSEAVNLSCSGLPAASACNFNPNVVAPPANGTALSAMQLTTTALSGRNSKNNPAPVGRSGAVYALVIPGLLALAGVGAIRRKHFGALRVLGLVMLLAAGSLGLSACNARYSYEHYHPSPNYGTGAGNYTIVIAAYSSNGTAITQATSSDANCAGAVCVALTVQ